MGFLFEFRREDDRTREQEEAIYTEIYSKFNKKFSETVTAIQRKNKDGYPSRYLLVEGTFRTTKYIYAQAVAAYSCQFYEASAALCRETIDDALYTALQFNWSDKMGSSKNIVDGQKLRNLAIEAELFDSNKDNEYLAKIEEYRRLGHTGIHLSPRKDREREEKWEEWRKNYKGEEISEPDAVIPYLQEHEVRASIDATGDFVIAVVNNLFTLLAGLKGVSE
ncbi:MAG: hypothetical protein KGH64_06080 [Candidatus Micrarchaeota archaeon]|nr:hypothetical protein [Candidatus Micrarchaeota archaeon]MDE1859204.1 hypothetical protein [Candidatus Micrarchaeota archaeon]